MDRCISFCPYGDDPLFYWNHQVLCFTLKDCTVVPAFFSPWKSKVPVKAFFGLFSTFFTDGKWLSRTLFSNFSRAVESFHGHFLGFFHGWVFFFTGRKLAIFENFHGWVFFFFTGRKWEIFDNFHARLFFFTGTKIDNIHKGFFHIQNLQDFGRIIISDPDYDKRQ